MALKMCFQDKRLIMMDPNADKLAALVDEDSEEGMEAKIGPLTVTLLTGEREKIYCEPSR